MSHKFTVIIQEEVVDELEEIYSFIAQDHPKNAEKFINELKKKIGELDTFPKRGTLCPEMGDDAERRFIVYKGYSITYRIVESEVWITHILAPGLNWRYGI